jgi:hypothetical protein
MIDGSSRGPVKVMFILPEEVTEHVLVGKIDSVRARDDWLSQATWMKGSAQATERYYVLSRMARYRWAARAAKVLRLSKMCAQQSFAVIAASHETGEPF